MNKSNTITLPSSILSCLLSSDFDSTFLRQDIVDYLLEVDARIILTIRSHMEPERPADTSVVLLPNVTYGALPAWAFYASIQFVDAGDLLIFKLAYM